MKLAIVHDYLNQMGGAERVLLTLHEIFPQAPIYTSIYAPELVDPGFRQMDVRTTFMQRLPLVHHHHRSFLPLFPFAFESIDLREYDVVLSMSSGWAKNVLTRPDTCHICYCLTPMRFAWSFRDYAPGEGISSWQMGVLGPILSGLRLWDVAGANRVDAFAAISMGVKRRIEKYYRREAAVIYPPVCTSGLHPRPGAPSGDRRQGDYFLTGGRMIPYKRIDLAIQACNRLKARLVVFGDGRDRARLEAMAGPHDRVRGQGGRPHQAGTAVGLPGLPVPGGGRLRDRPGGGDGGRAPGGGLRRRRGPGYDRGRGHRGPLPAAGGGGGGRRPGADQAARSGTGRPSPGTPPGSTSARSRSNLGASSKSRLRRTAGPWRRH